MRRTKKIGTADLKNNLSRYLRKVKSGERYIVTDHGEPVAELTPIQPKKTNSLEALIHDWVDRGIAEYDFNHKPFEPHNPIDIGGYSVTDLIRRMRDEE